MPSGCGIAATIQGMNMMQDILASKFSIPSIPHSDLESFTTMFDSLGSRNWLTRPSANIPVIGGMLLSQQAERVHNLTPTQQLKVNMKRSSSRLSPKLFWLVLIFIMFCLLIGTIACVGLGEIIFPDETLAPEAFPDTEIVFVSGKGLGFVNSDGSNPEHVKFVVKEYGNNSDFWRPVMGAESHTLIVKVVPSQFNVYNPHSLTIWRSGALPLLCKQWGEQQMPLLSADQSHIFTRTDQGMALYSLDDCGTENQPLKTYDNIFGIPSPDLKYLAYTNIPDAMLGFDRFIVIRDMDSGNERTIGMGDYAAWSRDSQWLAYTGKDGIYIVNVAEGAEPQRVILYPNLYVEGNPTYAEAEYWGIPPEVSWSPDGKWLVYHKSYGTDYHTGIDFSINAIYKVNIETGEETKIIDGGMYPYWRWPVEEP